MPSQRDAAPDESGVWLLRQSIWRTVRAGPRCAGFQLAPCIGASAGGLDVSRLCSPRSRRTRGWPSSSSSIYLSDASLMGELLSSHTTMPVTLVARGCLDRAEPCLSLSHRASRWHRPRQVASFRASGASRRTAWLSIFSFGHWRRIAASAPFASCCLAREQMEPRGSKR